MKRKSYSLHDKQVTLISKPTEATLLKDKQWGIIDGELVRITDFTPLLGCHMQGQEVVHPALSAPYASILLDCRQIPQDVEVTGFINHKMDFANLWAVFKGRGVHHDEEILAFWTRRHYRSRIMRPLSVTLPKLVLMITPKGTYQSIKGGYQWPSKDEALVMVYGLQAKEWWIPDVIR